MFFFAETNESVKDLALHATKLLMSKLTGYGKYLTSKMDLIIVFKNLNKRCEDYSSSTPARSRGFLLESKVQ